MNIVCIDDEKIILKGLERILLNIDKTYNVNCFTNAKLALDYFNDNMVDVVFLDVNMPSISGRELSKKIKRISPCVKIIYATGESKNDFISSVGLLLKPYSEEDVKFQLDNLHESPIKSIPGIFIKCFGEFEIYVNGERITFSKETMKESIAYLIYSKTPCSSKYIKKEFNISVNDLVHELKNLGIDSILKIGMFKVCIDESAFVCDCYEWDKGKLTGLYTFNGEYMSQYSWAKKEL